MTSRKLRHTAILVLALAGLACTTTPPAQTQPAAAVAPKFVIKPLLRAPFTGDDSKETVVVVGEFPPGSTTGRHTHPGEEYATVIEGSLELLADGREVRRVSAGEAYHNPRGLVHEARNVGNVPARLVATFVIDKGKPAMQPVAQ